MIDIWRELAQRFGDVKFCQMRADLCIEGYPEKNTPTVLVYKDGDIKKQLVTLRELRGTRTNAQGKRHSPLSNPGDSADYDFVTDVEQLLVDIGAVRIGDARLRRNKADGDADTSTSKIRQGESAVDPDDSDWD